MTDRTPNPDEVICPNCAHQFRAIPVNVQQELAALRVSGERVREACAKDMVLAPREPTREMIAATTRLGVATVHCATIYKAMISTLPLVAQPQSLEGKQDEPR